MVNGIWEIHAGCPSFLRVSSVAKIGYIPQFKASNARDQDEVSSDLARMWSTPAPIAQVVERPLRDREVAGSILGRAIPKA